MKARNMLWCLAFQAFLIWPVTANCQIESAGPDDFEVNINDNTWVLGAGNRYAITPDSVSITGQNDYGRTLINYLKRGLTPKERKKALAFLQNFSFDTLEDAYIGDTSVVLQGEHYAPRTIEISGRVGHRAFYSVMKGCYATRVVRFCEFMNTFLPTEVAIRVNKENFRVVYP